MTIVYEAQRYVDGSYTRTEFKTSNEAVNAVESAGSGSVIMFSVVQNAPGCLPKERYITSSMWCFEDGIWWSIDPFYGERVSQERPN